MNSSVDYSPVAKALVHLLADSYFLYLKTQQFHWNVRGPAFWGLHQMFEQQYTEMAAAIDEIAERIRFLGVLTPGSFKAFSQYASIRENEDLDLSPEQMVQMLEGDQLLCADRCRQGIIITGEHNDEASTDLFVGRQSVHEKNAWLLKSSLPS